MNAKLKTLIVFLVVFFGYFFVGTSLEAENIVFGVNFSQKHAESLGLDWKQAYSSLIHDLGAKDIKLITFWDLIEPAKDGFDFSDLDWQIDEAEKNGVEVMLVVGMKTGTWPECHVPDWADALSRDEQQERILNLVEKMVLRYKGFVDVWSVENEPLFRFGECPWKDKGFLKKEIALVKSLDPSAPVLVSDSGEWSFWIEAARLGDIVGATMYEKAWIKELGTYVSYLFPPVFYSRKALIVEKLFGKDVVCVELQAEPWCPELLSDCSLDEQEKTMTIEQFEKNIEFAKNTGLGKFYLWGGEWWYWMKEKNNAPAFWEQARQLF